MRRRAAASRAKRQASSRATDPDKRRKTPEVAFFYKGTATGSTRRRRSADMGELTVAARPRTLTTSFQD